ncbi:hypothetical protein [Devosia sp. A369]
MPPFTGPQPDAAFEGVISRDDFVGEGQTRKVFGVVGYADVVIKESKAAYPDANFTEWTVWHALVKMQEDILGNEPNAELRLLFAQCFAISETGRFLMMERLTKLEIEDPHPAGHKFPLWLNDKKKSAFGKAQDSQLKVMDYGIVNFYSALNPKNNQGIF